MDFQDTKRKKRQQRSDVFNEVDRDIAPSDDFTASKLSRSGSLDNATLHHYKEQMERSIAQEKNDGAKNDPQCRLIGRMNQSFSASNEQKVYGRRPRNQSVLDPFGNENSYGVEDRSTILSTSSSGIPSRGRLSGVTTIPGEHFRDRGDDRIFPGYAECRVPQKRLKRNDSHDRISYKYEPTYHYEELKGRELMNARTGGEGFPIVPFAHMPFQAPSIAQKAFRTPRILHTRSQFDEDILDEDDFDEDLGNKFVHKPIGGFASGEFEDDSDNGNHDSQYSKRIQQAYDANYEHSVLQYDKYKNSDHYKDDQDYPSDDDFDTYHGQSGETFSTSAAYPIPSIRHQTVNMLGGKAVATKTLKRSSPASEEYFPSARAPIVPPLESISIISNDSQKSSRGSQNSLEDRVPLASPHFKKRSLAQMEDTVWGDDSYYSRTKSRAHTSEQMDPQQPDQTRMYLSQRPEQYREGSSNRSGWIVKSQGRNIAMETSIFIFGPNESQIDFHILAMAGKTFDEGRFSSSKLIMDGFDYEFREMRSNKVLTPGRLGDVDTMAKNIANSFLLGQIRTIRVEIVNSDEFLSLGSRLTHIMILVGLREEKEPVEPLSQKGTGAVVTITDGKYKGCRGILRQINDGNALVRVATGDCKGKSVLIPKSCIEIMDETELLMHFSTSGRSNGEAEHLFNANMSVDSEVLHSLSDVYDTSPDDHFSVNEDKGAKKTERTPSIPNSDFLADISEHLVNSYDHDLYDMIVNEKEVTERPCAISYSGLNHVGDVALTSPHATATHNDSARSQSSGRRVDCNDTTILPLQKPFIDANDTEGKDPVVESLDDETDKESSMPEIPLPAADDLPPALLLTEGIDDEYIDDDDASEATAEEDNDEDFEITTRKPKKQSSLSKARKLPLATSRCTPALTATPMLSMKDKHPLFKSSSTIQSESIVIDSESESETSLSAHPTPGPLKRGRGRPKKPRDFPKKRRDTTSAWNFLQSLSVLELKDKLKQLKMGAHGNKGKLLEKIRSALDIDRDTPMEVLPDIVTKL